MKEKLKRIEDDIELLCNRVEDLRDEIAEVRTTVDEVVDTVDGLEIELEKLI